MQQAATAVPVSTHPVQATFATTPTVTNQQAAMAAQANQQAQLQNLQQHQVQAALGMNPTTAYTTHAAVQQGAAAGQNGSNSQNPAGSTSNQSAAAMGSAAAHHAAGYNLAYQVVDGNSVGAVAAGFAGPTAQHAQIQQQAAYHNTAATLMNQGAAPPGNYSSQAALAQNQQQAAFLAQCQQQVQAQTVQQMQMVGTTQPVPAAVQVSGAQQPVR